MKIAYLDCASGISGNMILGAFIDLGLSLDFLIEKLSSLPIKGYKIQEKEVKRKGIRAKLIEVEITEAQPLRHLKDILKILEHSKLEDAVIEKSSEMFRIIAEAEAKVHGCSREEVHFHEIGAVDALVDMVGTALGFHWLKADQVLNSALNVGHGYVNTAHGRLPIPAPATAEILKNYSIYDANCNAELVTPTGASIIACYAQPSLLPLLKISSIGYGAGSFDLDFPNVLRLIVGESAINNLKQEKALILEANLDDMNPEFYGYLMEKLFKTGVQDVYFTPIQMKKNRPATKISVLIEEALLHTVKSVIFEETTTLGLRYYEVQKFMLQREIVDVQTKFGLIKVKISYYENKTNASIAPEYEDCKRVADQNGLPLKTIWQEAYNQASKNWS